MLDALLREALALDAEAKALIKGTGRELGVQHDDVEPGLRDLAQSLDHQRCTDAQAARLAEHGHPFDLGRVRSCHSPTHGADRALVASKPANGSP